LNPSFTHGPHTHAINTPPPPPPPPRTHTHSSQVATRVRIHDISWLKVRPLSQDRPTGSLKPPPDELQPTTLQSCLIITVCSPGGSKRARPCFKVLFLVS